MHSILFASYIFIGLPHGRRNFDQNKSVRENAVVVSGGNEGGNQDVGVSDGEIKDKDLRSVTYSILQRSDTSFPLSVARSLARGCP